MQCIFIIPQFTEYVRGVYYPELCHENPKRSKIRQIDAVGSSKNVVRIGVVTTVGILAVNINLSYKILFVIFYSDHGFSIKKPCKIYYQGNV